MRTRSLVKTAFLGISMTIPVALSGATMAHSSAAHSKAIGKWLTENERAVIEIKSCDSHRSLCGEIYWIIDGGMQYDTENEDEIKRGQPLCGLTILHGFEKSDNLDQEEWIDGKIYKADDGDIYNASLSLVDENRLRVHGYVGIPLFGKTQMWTRVDEKTYSQCKAPPEKK